MIPLIIIMAAAAIGAYVENPYITLHPTDPRDDVDAAFASLFMPVIITMILIIADSFAKEHVKLTGVPLALCLVFACLPDFGSGLGELTVLDQSFENRQLAYMAIVSFLARGFVNHLCPYIY